MPDATIRTHGFRETERAFRGLDKELSKEFKTEIKKAAEIVAEEARSRFMQHGPRSAATMKARVKGGARGVVEQSRRKTSGEHPEWGALQMEEAFLPALEDKSGEVMESIEDMLDGLKRQYGF